MFVYNYKNIFFLKYFLAIVFPQIAPGLSLINMTCMHILLGHKPAHIYLPPFIILGYSLRKYHQRHELGIHINHCSCRSHKFTFQINHISNISYFTKIKLALKVFKIKSIKQEILYIKSLYYN
jgi:hypothetical protein